MRSLKPLLNLLCLALLALAVSLTGCAPGTVSEGVPYITRRHKVTDASVQRVAGYPCLRVDSASLDQLERSLAEVNSETARTQGAVFLRTAHDAALASSRNELDRLGKAGWSQLLDRYQEGERPDTVEARDALWQRYAAALDARYRSLRRRLADAGGIANVRRLLRPIRRRVQPSIKSEGRIGRAAPWFLFTIPSALTIQSIHAHEYRGAQEYPFTRAVYYMPADTSPAPAGIDADDWSLLQRYAPVLVQEVPDRPPPYDTDADRIGTVTAASADLIGVDPSHPAIYAYSRTVRIGRHDHRQLIYTQWYPEHPSLKRNDPERGHLEGTTLRLTLDRKDEPAIFETVNNCGCYHRLYPSQSIEATAQAHFGAPERHKTLALEHNVRWKIDMILPKAVETHSGKRPVLRARAGWHGLVDVSMDPAGHADEPHSTVAYSLLPYRDLERLALPGGGYTSMFYDNGLAKGAQRPEGVFFTPVGILSAGQPRQRGTQLLHWDQYDFDDPHLFERTLRLPDSF